MTLDELIEKLVEAKEHCVPGNTKVSVYKEPFSLVRPSKYLGTVSQLDFDNQSINIYIYE